MDASLSRRASISASSTPIYPGPATPVPTSVDIPSPEICVICLDLLVRSDASSSSLATSAGEPNGGNSHDGLRIATALPCQHAQFHQSCLGTWLSHSPSCPLCKTAVLSISVHNKGSSPELISIQTNQPQPPQRPFPRRAPHSQPVRRPSQRTHFTKDPAQENPVLAFRQQLYARRIPSLYLGHGIIRAANRSRQPLRRTITPASFSTNSPDRAALLHLATIWIRRELQLFPFLNPTSPPPLPPATSSSNASHPSSPPRHAHAPPRRRTTAFFLLPFILSVLQAIDLKGSAGQAQTLVGEYLGRANAALFCHELHAFLCSGAPTLQAWDEGVQYWFDDEGALRAGTGEVLGTVD